jgi:hypothetical protein
MNWTMMDLVRFALVWPRHFESFVNTQLAEWDGSCGSSELMDTNVGALAQTSQNVNGKGEK